MKEDASPAGGSGIAAIADPERALTVSYAPVHLRPGLAAIFALDERFGTIVGTTTEPMIGLMRLAWWREALESLDAASPPAEPLLALLAVHVLPHGVTRQMLATIEDGWSALLDDGDDMVGRHGAERGRNLFLASARLLGALDDRIGPVGEAWALADLAHRHSEEAVRVEARARAREAMREIGRRQWPKAARPLAALAVLAAWDAASDQTRRQGSPKRLARMLAQRLFGR